MKIVVIGGTELIGSKLPDEGQKVTDSFLIIYPTA